MSTCRRSITCWCSSLQYVNWYWRTLQTCNSNIWSKMVFFLITSYSCRKSWIINSNMFNYVLQLTPYTQFQRQTCFSWFDVMLVDRHKPQSEIDAFVARTYGTKPSGTKMRPATKVAWKQRLFYCIVDFCHVQLQHDPTTRCKFDKFATRLFKNRDFITSFIYIYYTTKT